jgi:hypothetical protein
MRAKAGDQPVAALVRPTGIEPVLRASEARILSIGRRSHVSEQARIIYPLETYG